MRRLTILLILPILALLVLAGCSTAAPTIPAPSAVPNLPKPAPAITDTAFPTETPQSTPTLWVTATQLVTATPTATAPAPTPDPALAQVKLIGLDWYRDYDLLLSFQFPGPVDPSKYRVTLEDDPYVKEYKCEVLQQYPNRLYCKGQGLNVWGQAWVRVYQAGSDKPGFERKQFIPYFTKSD